MTATAEKAQPMETSVWERISYGAYFAGHNIIYSLIQGYLLLYCVSYLEMNPALVATIFLIVRIWDAINDPLIGVVIDRVRLLNTRYKGWINITAFLVPLSTAAIFLIPPSAPLPLKVTLLVVAYLLWDVFYTASEVPMFAMSTSMTLHERERTLLLAVTQIGSVLGVVAGLVVFGVLVGDGVDQLNWVLVGGIPAGLALLMMTPQIFTVRERHNTDAVVNVPLGEMLRAVLQNEQHLMMMSLYLSQTFLNAAAVFAVYVGEGYYGNPRLSTFTSLFALLGVVLLGVLSPMIVRRIGKKNFLEWSMLATLALSIPVFFIPASMPFLALLFLGLRTATLVVTSLLRPMFTADCIEYGEHKTGVRSDSTAFAIQEFFNKTGDAIGVALGGYILALALFDETLPLAEQSVATINSLWLWSIVLPMIMAAVMYIGSRLLYRLDEEQVKEYIVANEARRAGALAEPAEAVAAD